MKRLLISLTGFAIGALALGLSVFSPYSQAMPPELAVQLLYGSGQEVHYDSSGYSYRVFRINESDGLKDLIDGITSRLLQTSIGTSLCRDVLEANWQALVHHLAMTPENAKAASALCSAGKESSPLVFDSPTRSLRKFTMSGQDSPRRYIIVVTNQPHLPFDSWTDAYTNKTTLFVYNSKESSDLNLRHLTQIIAHEMAIYFDAKSWPMGPEWNNIPELASSQLRSSNEALTLSAALNPAISTVLALIRAYKIEYQMIYELKKTGQLGADSLFYSLKEYPFLSAGCEVSCLTQFIKDQQSWLTPIQHALLAFSPHYRARRLEVLRAGSNSVTPSFVIDSLERFPLVFLSLQKSDLVALDLVTLNRTAAELEAQSMINRAMNEFLIPADLKALSEAKILVPNNSTDYDLLNYLSMPLLSDSNTNLSAGPRPRIRTGGTQ